MREATTSSFIRFLHFLVCFFGPSGKNAENTKAPVCSGHHNHLQVADQCRGRQQVPASPALRDGYYVVGGHGIDGDCANPREDATARGGFLALSFSDGSPIPDDHGGPRIVLPHLFGWKSCKWLHSIEFLDDHRQGFWEKLGCHARGRVKLGERWAPRSKSLWDALVSALTKLIQAALVPEQKLA